MLRLALVTVAVGLALFASTGHCAEMAPDVARELGALRAEVKGLGDQVTRLVQAQERDHARRPAYEADVHQAREAVLSELRSTRADHDTRISSLETARWYLLGVLAVLGVLGRALWQGRRLEVRHEAQAQAPPAKPPA
jgi:hypothetical protein